MSAERPHHELGYSRWDKLAPESIGGSGCLHFKGKPAGKAAKRGTNIHDEVQKIMEGGFSDNPVAIAAAARVKGCFDEITSIEEKLVIQDDNFDEVAFGYADYIGWDREQLVVADLKTGSQPPDSYRLQLTGLAYAAMEEYGAKSCRCILVYADSEETPHFEVTYTEAKEASMELIAAYKNRENEAPSENSYCGWCANKAHCPVFQKPIRSLLAIDEAADIAAAGFSKEAILANPETASRFWGAYKKFVTLVEEWEVDGQMKAWITAGETVPGYKIQTRKGRQLVDTESVLREVVGKIGHKKAASFVTIKVTDLVKTWEGFTTEPLPVQITEGEPTTVLVAAKGGK